MTTGNSEMPKEEPDEVEEMDRIDEQEDESFPASDPHSDWAGPGR